MLIAPKRKARKARLACSCMECSLSGSIKNERPKYSVNFENSAKEIAKASKAEKKPSIFNLELELIPPNITPAAQLQLSRKGEVPSGRK